MKITTVGIDLAKNVFQIHAVDEREKPVQKKQLRRTQMGEYFAKLPPCVIGMEACGSAHFWARKLQSMGHTVKLMAPQFVKPYVKTNKHDAADAEAICEAVRRPNMRFVAVKTVSQQELLAFHRARSGKIKERTAQANQIRGFLSEVGIVLPQGIAHLPTQVPVLLDEAKDQLTSAHRQLIMDLLEHLKYLTRFVDKLEAQINAWHKSNEMSRRLAQIPGIGPITATALLASIGDIKNFANSRQLAAWLGLVPKQHSSGGKTNLQGISKRGDVYLRTLLIHGARAVIAHAQRKLDADGWLQRLIARRNPNVAAVALANKNARIVWALLMHNRQFRANYAEA